MSFSQVIRTITARTDSLIALAILAVGALAIIAGASLVGGPFLILGLSLFGTRRTRPLELRNRRLGSLRSSFGIWNRPAIAAARADSSDSIAPAQHAA
jgi:hypothetical protein